MNKNAQLIVWGVVVLVVIGVIASAFILNPNGFSRSGTPSSSSTQQASFSIFQAGQYPPDFEKDLVFYPKMVSVMSSEYKDEQGKQHVIAEFIPPASAAQVFNTYKSKLPTIGWNISGASLEGTSTLSLAANHGKENLSVDVTITKIGSKLRLETY